MIVCVALTCIECILIKLFHMFIISRCFSVSVFRTINQNVKVTTGWLKKGADNHFSHDHTYFLSNKYMLILVEVRTQQHIELIDFIAIDKY